MATDNADKTKAAIEHDPAFWIQHAHSSMRELAGGLISEIERIPPLQRGNLIDTAQHLVRLLDEVTKLDQGGFGMVPPRGPVASPGGGSDNDGMEAKLAKLEATVTHLEQDIADLKVDVRKMRDDITGIRTTDFRTMFGAIIAVALSLSGLMAKGFGWI